MKQASVKIIADSTCDFSQAEAQKSGVTIVPMSFSFGEEIYRQGVDLSTADFYQKQAASTVQPVTAQLTSYDLELVYRKAVQDGSEAVAIHLSSAMSGTYQSAVLASREVGGVYPVDSQNATFGSALLVREAVKLRDAGKSAPEIAQAISLLTGRVRVFAYVSTLKYLVRGGRVSAVAGMLGGALNICPIIAVQNGEVKSIGKVRGKAAVKQEILRLAETAGIDPDYDVLFGHAMDEAGLVDVKAVFAELVRGCQTYDHEVGPVIGTHTGPGAVGIAFIGKD